MTGEGSKLFPMNVSPQMNNASVILMVHCMMIAAHGNKICPCHLIWSSLWISQDYPVIWQRFISGDLSNFPINWWESITVRSWWAKSCSWPCNCRLRLVNRISVMWNGYVDSVPFIVQRSALCQPTYYVHCRCFIMLKIGPIQKQTYTVNLH